MVALMSVSVRLSSRNCISWLAAASSARQWKAASAVQQVRQRVRGLRLHLYYPPFSTSSSISKSKLSGSAVAAGFTCVIVAGNTGRVMGVVPSMLVHTVWYSSSPSDCP